MAGNISKHFYDAVADKTCADFHHPGKTCVQALRECAAAGFSGSLKFYLPLCILPLLFKIKRWNEKKTWKEFLVNYSRCVFSGFFITTTGFWVFCMFYQVFKGFYLPLSVCLPSSLGAVFCGIMPRKFVHIDGIGLFNIYLEFVIKQSKRPSIVWLRNSLVGATCLYSVFNSIMIYCLYTLKSHRFWFVNIGSELKAFEKGAMEGKCGHTEVSCDEHLKKEFKSMSLFAFGIALFKLIFPRISSIARNPVGFLTTFHRKLDYSLMAFLIASNGIFKFAFCRLNSMARFPKHINCLIAGFLSSLGYVFYPRYIIFTMGMTSIIEALYKYVEHVYEQQQRELPRIMTIINRLPCAELLYMFSIGITFQLRVIYPHLTNRFIHKMMAVGSGGRSDEVTKNYFKMMVGW